MGQDRCQPRRPSGAPEDQVPTSDAAWTSDQLRAFLDSVRDDRLYPAWLLASTTGMRRGEVLGLRWTDVDPDAGRVSIVQSRGSTRDGVRIEEPKSAPPALERQAMGAGKPS